MAENDQINGGANVEGDRDPDRLHAALAQAIADIPPADEVTKARHLHAAMTAFADIAATHPSPSHDASDAPQLISLRKLRLYRTLGAVAAATLAIVSFGVIVPLLTSNGSDDTGIMASETFSDAPGVPLTVMSADEPSEVRPSEMRSESGLSASSPTERFFNLSGLCTDQIEELTYELTYAEGSSFSWVAYEVVDDGTPVILVESASELLSLDEAAKAVGDSVEPPEVLLVLDPATCALLRVERAGP
jgi:hypothetical protein